VSRVDDRARIIFDVLRVPEVLNQGLLLPQMLARTGLQNTGTTRKAIQRVSILAERAGLCMPACGPATGYRYMVTDNAQMVVESTFDLTRIESGIRRRRRRQDTYVSDNLAALSPGERQFHESRMRIDTRIEQLEGDVDVMVQAVEMIRREVSVAGSAG